MANHTGVLVIIIYRLLKGARSNVLAWILIIQPAVSFYSQLLLFKWQIYPLMVLTHCCHSLYADQKRSRLFGVHGWTNHFGADVYTWNIWLIWGNTAEVQAQNRAFPSICNLASSQRELKKNHRSFTFNFKTVVTMHFFPQGPAVCSLDVKLLMNCCVPVQQQKARKGQNICTLKGYKLI